MAILKSCCCWKSVRSGSFASGIYTLTFYIVVVTAGSFHVHNVINFPVSVPVLLVFSVLMLMFAALSVVSSAVLIIGLCTNNRLLLLPWIICITMTTALDVILSFYFISDSEVDPFFAVLFIMDIILCGLNVYCILCVTSQYQEYMNGRGRPRQVMIDGGIPAIHFEPPSCIVGGGLLSCPSRRGPPKGTLNFDDGSSSMGGRGSAPHYRALVGGGPYNCRGANVSRSSFSSTSEFSFYSSSDGGLLPGSSRRGSSLPAGGLSPVGEAVQAEAAVSPEASADESPASETLVVVPEEDAPIADSWKEALVISRFRHSGLFSNIIPRQLSSTFNRPNDETQEENQTSGEEPSVCP